MDRNRVAYLGNKADVWFMSGIVTRDKRLQTYPLHRQAPLLDKARAERRANGFELFVVVIVLAIGTSRWIHHPVRSLP